MMIFGCFLHDDDKMSFGLLWLWGIHFLISKRKKAVGSSTKVDVAMFTTTTSTTTNIIATDTPVSLVTA